MKNNISDVSIFSLHEVINPENHPIRLRIVTIDAKSNTFEAIVIKAEGFFAEFRDGKRGHPQDGFRLGMNLVFVRHSHGGKPVKNQDNSQTFHGLNW